MIPDYQTCMLPLLKYAADKSEHKFSDAVEYLSDEFALTKEERKELLPSKTQDVITNRIGWARTYLKRRDFWKILVEDILKLQKEVFRFYQKILKNFLQNIFKNLMNS